MNLMDAQERLEKDMVERGRARFMALRQKAEETGDASRSAAYRVVLDAALEPLSEAVRGFLEESRGKRVGRRLRASILLEELPPEAVAYVSLAIIVSATVRGPSPLTALAERIGRAIEVESFYARMEKEDPDHAFHQKKRIRQASTKAQQAKVAKHFAGSAERLGVKDRWTLTDKITVGMKLFELVVSSTGLFQAARKRDRKRTVDVAAPTPQYKEWVEALSSQLASVFPAWLPMVVPPRDWSGLTGGGYITDAFPYPPTLVRNASKAHREALARADLTAVYRAVNAIQRTPWQINAGVLAVAEALIEEGAPVAGLPDMHPLPLPARPDSFDANEAVSREWKRQAAVVHESNAKALSGRFRALSAISTAREFADREEIFFPHNMDFRGRIYPIPTQITPQGTDLQKGLLRFSQGAPLRTLEGARWFEIHGANCYGVDKVKFSKRQEWVAENADHICASASAPLDYRWWTQADDPFQFLAWCLEYAEWRGTGFDLGYVSRIPVAMDGSCNGIQHYSAMLRDPKGGKAVNLTPCEEPQDLYREVSNEVNTTLRTWEEPEGREHASFWLSQGIDRSTCKPVVIAYSFGGKLEGAYQAVLMDMAERGVQHPNLPAACRFLSKVIMEAAKGVCKGAERAFRWLSGIAKAANGPLTWAAPSGFVVRVDYRKTKKAQIEMIMFGKRFQPVVQEATDETDTRRQAASFPPHYAHSMDAAHLVLTVNSACSAGMTQFAMVHDSYGVPAGHAPSMAKALREAFVGIYQSEPLERLVSDLGLPPEAPLSSPPYIGGLDIPGILKSDYFFA